MGERSAFWGNGLRLGEIGFIFNRANISWGREDGGLKTEGRKKKLRSQRSEGGGQRSVARDQWAV
jgi:hypothetical protein